MAQRINEVVPIALRRGGFAVGFPSFHAGQNHTDLLSDEAVAFFDREGLEIVLALVRVGCVQWSWSCHGHASGHALLCLPTYLGMLTWP